MWPPGLVLPEEQLDEQQATRHVQTAQYEPFHDRIKLYQDVYQSVC